MAGIAGSRPAHAAGATTRTGRRPLYLDGNVRRPRRKNQMTDALPTDPKARKAIPVYSGFIKYFPRAICAVAELSRIGNDEHNPGKSLHWDRSKSGDEK